MVMLLLKQLEIIEDSLFGAKKIFWLKSENFGLKKTVKNYIYFSLWELCNAEHSHISQVGVPLLLHCITLPVGSDVFWKILQEFFHHSDWRVRFQAVERVTVIARFMDSTPLRTEVNLQTALATAFCHLIASMDDINVYVAQRATLYLGTIHDTAIRVSHLTSINKSRGV